MRWWRTNRNTTTPYRSDATGLRRDPLEIRGWWTQQVQATAIPGKPWRREYVIWTLHFSIECESTEVLLAEKHGTVPVRLSRRSGAGHVWEVCSTFRPQLRRLEPIRVRAADGGERVDVPWEVTTTLHIAFGGRLVQVDDAALVSDPTTLVHMRDDTTRATSGSVIRLASIPRCGLTHEVFCVAKSDTRNSHGRWIVKPDLRAHVPPDFQRMWISTGA